jgi:hypothetical protein
VSCGSAPANWSGVDVQISCTATDGGVGTTQAPFTLSTHVASGTATANASTDTLSVCDRLGNCTTAGPITGIKVDKVAPTITLTAPTNGAVYSAGQTVLANYSCADADSGIAAVNGCVGTVASGSAIDTSPGTHTFTVTATDAVGNITMRTVTYTTSYRICYLYDTTTPQSRTGTVVIKVQLCDAAGNNLSTPQITLTAVYEDTPGQLPSPNFQGKSNYGYDFRFSSGQYLYNLDPTTPPALGAGSHALYFVVKGTTAPIYVAPFVLK